MLEFPPPHTKSLVTQPRISLFLTTLFPKGKKFYHIVSHSRSARMVVVFRYLFRNWKGMLEWKLTQFTRDARMEVNPVYSWRSNWKGMLECSNWKGMLEFRVNLVNPWSKVKPTCYRFSDSKQRATKIRFRMRDINCNEPSERELPLRQHFSCFLLVLRSDSILALLFGATKHLDFCPTAPLLKFGHSPTVL